MSAESCLIYLEYQVKRFELGLLTGAESLKLFTIIHQMKFTNITGINDLKKTIAINKKAIMTSIFPKLDSLL